MVDDNLQINYDEMLQIIRNQLVEVMEDSYYYFENYKVKVSLWQQYVKIQNKDPNAIYIVVKFLPASVYLGQTILPLTIEVMSEANKIDACLKLLTEYAQKFTLEQAGENNTIIQQTYDSPTITSNFNQVFAGLRSVMYMSGTFLLSKDANDFDIYYNYSIVKPSISLTTSDNLKDKVTIKDENFYFSTYPSDITALKFRWANNKTSTGYSEAFWFTGDNDNKKMVDLGDYFISIPNSNNNVAGKNIVMYIYKYWLPISSNILYKWTILGSNLDVNIAGIKANWEDYFDIDLFQLTQKYGREASSNMTNTLILSDITDTNATISNSNRTFTMANEKLEDWGITVKNFDFALFNATQFSLRWINTQLYEKNVDIQFDGGIVEIISKNDLLNKYNDSTTIILHSENFTGWYDSSRFLNADNEIKSWNDFQESMKLSISGEPPRLAYISIYIDKHSLIKESEKVPCIKVTLNGQTQLDTQVFFDTNNFTKSSAKAATNIIAINSFFMYSVQLFNKALEVYGAKLQETPEGINYTFNFDLIFKNGTKISAPFKLAQFTLERNIGNIPVVALTFTN
ncbi:hypothetical protein [Mammaliicoccus vitulinus]|uniref:hypothetical protein n=1 Tax=Mammaliicoccus vitulinus TaxID=71237 RepID=UPI00248B5CA3|nr:hypothetical protein [Mammaliicoccus vitulinus]